MKRILVVGCLPGINGIASCIYNLYKNLDKTQFEWEFLVSKDALESGLGFDGIESLGARIHSLDYSRTNFPRPARKQLRNLMQTIPDLCGVHLHDSGRINAYPIYLAHQMNLPIRVIQIHSAGGATGRPVEMTPHRLAAKRHMISGDSVDRLACSKKAGIYAYGNLPFSFFPNGVDLNRFSFNPIHRQVVRDKLDIPNSATVIGFLGHFWHVKNPLFAIEVFREYHSIQPNSHLILLGDGPLRSEAYHICNVSGLLPYVHFLGFQADMELFLNAMDLILCTSITEGLCNAVVEAQSTGLPCLVSDGVPHEALITDLCTRLSLNSPAELWAQKIVEILHYRAPRRSYHAELKRSGFDISDSAKTLLEYYNKRLTP